MHAIIEEKLLHRAPEVFAGAERQHGLTWHPVPALAEALALNLQRESGATAIVTGTGSYSRDFYAALSPGTLVQRFGVGYEAVPIDLCRDAGLFVGYTPGVLDAAVAEHALALLLALARNIIPSHLATKAGHWRRPAGTEVSGKNLALIGFGQIARRLAAIAREGLGMRVTAFGRRTELDSAGLQLCDEYTTNLDDCLAQADFVSLHLAATPATRHLVNQAFFDRMKTSAYLINTARGSLIDESALFHALQKQRIAGAALDVFNREPYEPDGHDFRELDNCLLSPHSGSNTAEANSRMASLCVASIIAHAAGRMDDVFLIPEFRL